MFIGLLCAAFAMPLLFPRTPFGVWFKRLLVDRPAAFLARVTLIKVLLLLVMVVASIAFIQAFPAELAWLAAADVATYVEIVAMLLLTAASGLIRSSCLRLASIAARLGQWSIQPIRAFDARGRARSQPRRPRLPRPRRADDGDAPSWGLAYAF